MNLEPIKRMGAFLGLEAELKAQQRCLTQDIDDKKWKSALQRSENIKAILEGIIELALGPKCDLTSPKTS